MLLNGGMVNDLGNYIAIILRYGHALKMNVMSGGAGHSDTQVLQIFETPPSSE